MQMYMVESLHCSPETITTLLTYYTQYKIKNLKKQSDPKCKPWLGVTMMYQCDSLLVTNVPFDTTLVQNGDGGEGCACVGAGGIGELYALIHFCCGLKTSLKMNSV